jgi:hypothetical protein
LTELLVQDRAREVAAEPSPPSETDRKRGPLRAAPGRHDTAGLTSLTATPRFGRDLSRLPIPTRPFSAASKPANEASLPNQGLLSRPSGAAEPRYFTIEAAAAVLSLNPHALRARCRRRARREGRSVVAHLGGGIEAIKLGVTWRIRFPE